MIDRIGSLEFQQRLQHGDHAIGFFLRRQQLRQLHAGFDVFRVGLIDLFKDLDGFRVLLGGAVRLRQ